MKNTSTSSAKSTLLFLLSVYVSSFTFGFLNISGKVYQDIPKIEIRSNKISRYKLNIKFNGNDESVNNTISHVVVNNLEITKLFNIYTTHDEDSQSTMGDIEFYCNIEINKNSNIIEARIKIKDAKHKRSGKSNVVHDDQEFVINGKHNYIHLLGHKISNHIFETITNMKGLFDTKIIYVEDTTDKTIRKEKCKNETGINSNTNTRLAQMDFGGTNHSYIIKSSGNGIFISPKYSPDNTKIAYVAFDRNAKKDKDKVFNIHIYDVKKKKSYIAINDSITKALTKHFDGKVPQMSYAPRFSHDGNSIVFAMVSDGTSAIYSYDLVNKKICILTKHRYNTKKAIDTSPCYIKDGKGIVFTSDKYGIEQIFTMDIDGKNEKRLTYKRGKYSQPVSSPNGDLIAFTKQQNNQFYICTMDINGRNEKELVSGYLVEEPCFSPDGRYIAFTYAPNSMAYSRIAVVDITGRHMFILKTPSDRSCFSPAWSNSYEL